MTRTLATALILLLAVRSETRAADAVRRGEIVFTPARNESQLPRQFRLSGHKFSFQQQAIETVSNQIEISAVTFPSPVTTKHRNNNTVHCEYFRPKTKGAYPGVIVLHILGGDFNLSRLFARTMAHHEICALFVKMPYYGPRRQPGSSARMVSLDPDETVRGMTQAVLDIRRAAAWLGQQEEVDENCLGVFGISLGGITGALSAAAEPRLRNIVVALAGGDISRVGWNSPYAAVFRKKWLDGGGSLKSLTARLQPIDPTTYAKNVRGRRILMINARYDEIIPNDCSLALWRSLGQPEIAWLDSGHISSARYMFDILARVTRFFQRVKK